MKHRTIIEPFKIKTVEPFSILPEEERIKVLKDAHYNPFLINSEHVIIDLLTDSGTSAMSSDQWAGIAIGDEAYAGSRSWFRMKKAVEELTGFEFILPTHQGRAAERIIYGILGGEGKTFISNTHFDTTRANIEYTGADAIDIPCMESADPSIPAPFKGNMDTERLREIIEAKGKDNVAAVILTLTNNSGGGQPVSMANTKEVSAICRENGIRLILDCCRIAENSYFIQHREEGYASVSAYDIARTLFSYADGAVMSAKKDALVNMGGFLAVKDEQLAEDCQNLLIITEGFSTYGGLSGRDMEAIAIGLNEVFQPDYLEYRIKSMEYIGKRLTAIGIPIMLPVGGHAIYIDAKKLYPQIPSDQYPGQALVCELYRLGGIRSVEIGSVMFGKYDEQGQLIPAPHELVRLALPRRVYTQSHMEYVIETLEQVYAERAEIKGYKIVKEAKFLRHFTARFEPLNS